MVSSAPSIFMMTLGGGYETLQQQWLSLLASQHQNIPFPMTIGHLKSCILNAILELTLAEMA